MSISTVTSEALQAKLRQLLPSQRGFGTDLSASDTIIPVIDLTEAAEGSQVRSDLQTAFAHGSVTAFAVSNTTTTIISTTGFFRVFGSYGSSSAGSTADFSISDGSTDKKLIEFNVFGSGNSTSYIDTYEFVVFLSAGDSLKATTSTSTSSLDGCTRQIADINGNLVNPVGFTPS